MAKFLYSITELIILDHNMLNLPTNFIVTRQNVVNSDVKPLFKNILLNDVINVIADETYLQNRLLKKIGASR